MFYKNTLLRKLLLPLVMAFFFVSSAQATTYIVDDLGDPGLMTGGTLNLRQAIAGAVSGDEVVINVSGTIFLTSIISVSEGIEIKGAEPIHAIINCQGGKGFRFSAVGTSRIEGITITNGGGLTVNEGVFMVDPGALLDMNHMVLIANNSRALYNNGGTIVANNCSFINNLTTFDGGALYNTNNGNASFYNCTFGENATLTAGDGGAIYADNGNIDLVHCTLCYNSTLSSGGAIHNQAANVTIENCAIVGNLFAVGGQLALIGGIYTSNGGNFSDEAVTLWTPQGSDEVNQSAFTALATSPLTDGYGYVYYPILATGSSLIDRANFIAGLNEDTRRAPRVLDADFDAVPQPDRGAVEFTQFCVSALSGSDDLNDIYTQINTTANAPPYFVCFDIPGGGPHIIDAGTYTFTDEVHIDGYSQPGSAVAGPGTPGTLFTPANVSVYLDGGPSSSTDGIIISSAGSANSTIRGLGIMNYSGKGITIQSDFVHVSGCHIGFDPSQTAAPNNIGISVGWIAGTPNNTLIGGPNLWDNNCLSGNTAHQVRYEFSNGNDHHIFNNFIGTITDGSTSLVAGATADGIFQFGGLGLKIGQGNGYFPGNVISGNEVGIYLNSSVAVNDTIQSNFIGVDFGGDVAVPNVSHGILVNGSSIVQIGGDSDYAKNVISGNGGVGISLNSASFVKIHGNHIGVSEDGLNQLGNVLNGVGLSNAANNNEIGGTAPATRNIISDNNVGVFISGVGADDNIILNNYIGTDITGTADFGNNKGIQVDGSASGPLNNQIGGSGLGNVVSGNDSYGIEINNASSTNVFGNIIGLSADGLNPLGNGNMGILVAGNGSNNTIGGANALDRNIVSANAIDGIRISGTSSNNNQVLGNYIGTDINGVNNLGNSANGVTISGGPTNTIVGAPGAGNLISANGASGIYLTSNTTNTSLIQGNTIGLDATGAILGNTTHGVQVANAVNTQIGGMSAGEPNTISGNVLTGVYGLSAGVGTVILGNVIGLDASATLPRGNGTTGVYINSSNPIQIGDGAGGGNTIANNGSQGIYLQGNACVVKGNYIGTNSSNANFGNGSDGVRIIGSNNIIGGVLGGEGNTIAYNANDGVEIFSAASINNSILQNSIYSNSELGIDLSTSGVDLNDPLDVDAGANNIQNFPIINAVTTNCNGSGTNFLIALNSEANKDYRIELFYVPAAFTDPSGYGEGPTFVDNLNVTTDASGNATVVHSIGTNYTVADYFTATATVDNAGTLESTSEFSPYAIINDQPSFPGTWINSPVSCFGESDGFLFQDVVDGSMPYTWLWDNGSTNDTAQNLSGGTYAPTVTDAVGCSATGASLTVFEPAQLILSATSTDPLCPTDANGTISLSGTGGSPGYQYSIDGGSSYQAGSNFTGLAEGAYMCVILDLNSCTDSLLVTLTDPTPLSYTSVTSTDPTCLGSNDGTITIVGTGGTGTINFSIDGGTTYVANNPNFTNLIPGTYNVIVTDANGCSLAYGPVITITDPPAVTHSVTITHENCNLANGQIVVGAAGGDGGPYQYSNDGGITFGGSNTYTGLVGGSFPEIQVMDGNGCLSTPTTETINNIPAQSIDQVNTTQPSCNGGSDGTIDIVVSGGISPYTYSIDGGATYQAGSSFAGVSAGTYNISVLDGNGQCEQTTNITIFDVAALTVSTSGTIVTCNGGSDGTATANVTGGTPGYTYSWTPSGGTGQTASGLSAGTYTVWVDDANGCGPISEPYIVNEPTAIVLFSLTDSASCNLANGQITLMTSGGNGGPYQFSMDGGATWQTSNTFTNVAAGSYTVQSQDASGCFSPLETAVVGTIPPPTYTNITLTDPSCNGDSDGQITINASGGLTGTPYSINGGAWQTGNTFTGLAAGSHTLSIMDTNGCQVDSTVMLTNPPVLQVLVVNPFGPTCNGGCDGQIQITNVVGGTPSYMYSVDGTNFQTGSSFAGLCAGGYYAFARDINGCTDSVFVNLPDPALEDGSFDYVGVTSFCHNSGSWTPNITGTPGGTFGVNQGGIDINISTGVLNMNATTFVGAATVTYTTPCGVTGTLAIQIDSMDVATFFYGSNTYCVNDSNATPTITGTPTGVFSASPAGLQFVSTTSGEINFSGSTPNTYTITFTTTGPCPDTETFVISIASQFVAQFDGNSPSAHCLDAAPFTYTATPAGGTFSGNGITAAGVFTPSTAGPGTQMLYYTIGSGACQGVDSIAVTVHDVPTITLSGGGNYCAGTPIPSITFNYNSSTLPISYDIFEGTTFITNISTNNASDVFNPSGPGTYFAQNIVDANGCSTAASNNSVDVIEDPIPATPTMSSDTTYCLGDAIVTLLAVPTTGQSSWYSDAGLTNLITIGTPYLPTITSPGVYTYYAVATSGAGCVSAVGSVTLTILDAPTAPPSANGGATSFEYCEGDSLIAMGAFPNAGGTINWYDGFGTFLASGSNYTPTGIGIGTYSFFANEAIGSCEGPGLAFSVTIYGAASVDAGPDQAICLGDSVQLNASGGASYTWNQNGFVSDTAVENPWVSAPFPSWYFVSIESAGNCIFLDSVFVDILPEDQCIVNSVSVFNVFSPDGDGVNDIWVIADISNFGPNSVKLFNRWGDVLQTFNDYDNNTVFWDGTDKNGEILPAGTYFYIIETQDPHTSASGWVQLMR